MYVDCMVLHCKVTCSIALHCIALHGVVLQCMVHSLHCNGMYVDLRIFGLDLQEFMTCKYIRVAVPTLLVTSSSVTIHNPSL